MSKSFGGNLRGAFEEISHHLAGDWDGVLIQAMFALSTREHIFWLSGPGRAKSWAARMIFSLFPDSKQFMMQITKDTLPSAVFGNENPKEYMETGKEIFCLDGGICDCHLAYLDEFLDGPDFLVRALNTVLNERVFERKDMGRVNVPLHSGIMTTNFDRYGTALEAVRDRMMCKAHVPTADTTIQRIEMYDSYLSYAGGMPPLPSFSIEELTEFAGYVEDPNYVEIPDEIRLLHGLLISQFQARRIKLTMEQMKAATPDKEIEPSDIKVEEITPRTEAKLLDFSRAAALLNDRRVVSPTDLRALRFGLFVLNDEEIDERAWYEVCDELLKISQAQLKRLRDYAAISRRVYDLRKPGTDFKQISVQIAGKTETYTKTTLLEAIDTICGRDTGAIALMAEDLKREIGKIGAKPHQTIFPWDGDWAK